MKEAVESFLTGIKEKEHLLQLIDKNRFSLTFKQGQENISLAFKDGEIHLDFLLPNYELSGDISRLLEGEKTLRALIRSGNISINAPFRVLLMLESFFYLGKESQNLQKII
jgi:hypothetical protein